MTAYEKLLAAPLLLAVKAAGVTVRGLQSLRPHRGCGTSISAASIRVDGVQVHKLSVITFSDDPVVVRWRAGQDVIEVRLVVSVSDDGELRFSPVDETIEPPPETPSWQ